ncbi:MAG: ATP-binding protein [Stellaceae bacterium]
MDIRLFVILIVVVVLIAIFAIMLQRTRAFRGLRAERDNYLAELAAAEQEREVSSAQIAGMMARVAVTAGTLDALPLPVWHRRKSDLALIEGNEAYARAVDAGRDAAIAEQRELAPGILGEDGKALAMRARTVNATQRESHHIVIGGARRFLEITEVPLPHSDRMVGFARDFTDLESLEAELRRHTDAHAEVLEHLAVAIAIFGADQRLSFFNHAFAALWQVDPDWLQTQPPIDELLERLRELRRLPEQVDFPAYKRGVAALFTSLIKPREEMTHLPDGRTLRMDVAPHPFGGLIFVYEDVTDRLALERSFNTLTEVQRETLDNLKEGVAVFGTDGRLKLWNPAFAAMWRLAPDALGGEPHLSEIVDRSRALLDDGADWPAQRRTLVARYMNEPAIGERIARKDGAILQFAMLKLPDGNHLFLYLDITDSTRLQTALAERNDALEAADRLKSEFIANVSYELRTPLNVISGFAELLEGEYFGKLNERQHEYGAGILESAQSLAALIGDILDLSSIEAGHFSLEREAVDLRLLLVSLRTLAQERARHGELRFRLDCPEDIGRIDADPRRLKQALFNLLSNAFKFTPPGGEVTLAARRGDDGVAISVSDTGQGVPAGDVDRVFEKFERGTAPTRGGGAGLGLALVKSIIELHGGRVELDSVTGIGTAVVCHLPDAGQEDEAPARVPAVAEPSPQSA